MLAWIIEHWIWIISALPCIALILGYYTKASSPAYKTYKGKGIELDRLLELLKESTTVSGHDTVYSPKWYEILQEELDRLSLGRIAFNPPSVMKVGKGEIVEVRISKDLGINLTTALKGRGISKVDELQVSELMKVRLSGTDFDIIDLTEENQIIGANGYTEWEWDVTPLKSGSKVLYLHVAIRIRLPFGEERKDLPVLNKPVLVRINPLYSMFTFVFSYWKWLSTAIIIPVSVFLWKTIS